MRVVRSWTAFILLFFILGMIAFAGTVGSFRGTVVESDEGRPEGGWLYVRGRDGGIRRVDISHASIAYDDDAAHHPSKPQQDDLVPGTEVRVTAEQGSDGEWRAKSIEVLKKSEGAKPSGKVGKS
jgi:hypothetical protein